MTLYIIFGAAVTVYQLLYMYHGIRSNNARSAVGAAAAALISAAACAALLSAAGVFTG